MRASCQGTAKDLAPLIKIWAEAEDKLNEVQCHGSAILFAHTCDQGVALPPLSPQ